MKNDPTPHEREEWRAIPGFPGYLVSSLGTVFSHKSGRELRGHVHKPDGYIRVGLMMAPRKQRKVMAHGLVMLAFVGPCPDGEEIRHLDGDPTNNRLTNLTYGTPRENNLDTVRHGKNLNARKAHCPQRHPLDERNTYVAPNGSRKCRTCRQAAHRAWSERTASRAAGIAVAS